MSTAVLASASSHESSSSAPSVQQQQQQHHHGGSAGLHGGSGSGGGGEGNRVDSGSLHGPCQNVQLQRENGILGGPSLTSVCGDIDMNISMSMNINMNMNMKAAAAENAGATASASAGRKNGRPQELMNCKSSTSTLVDGNKNNVGSRDSADTGTGPCTSAEQLKASSVSEPVKEGVGAGAGALSPELLRILEEVSQTGTCSSLPWTHPLSTALPSFSLSSEQPPSYPASIEGEGETEADGAFHSTQYTASATGPSSSASAMRHYKQSIPSAAARQHQQPHSFHRRPTPLYASAAASSAPPRKKHRNGMHLRQQRRFTAAVAAAAAHEGMTSSTTTTTMNGHGHSGTSKTTTSMTTTTTGSSTNTGNPSSAGGGGSSGGGGGRKRPLFLIRTNSSSSPPATNVFSPGSVGSARTSGSEPEDTSQYECDSEGTSATSNSEMSFERRDHLRRRMALQKSTSVSSKPTSAATASVGDEEHLAQQSGSGYSCLRDVVRTSLRLVLDHFYKTRGGYKLSPAEERRKATLQTVEFSQLVRKGDHQHEGSIMNGYRKMISSDRKAAASVHYHQDLSRRGGSSFDNGSGKATPVPEAKAAGAAMSSEEIFQQRRQRLLNLLGPAPDEIDDQTNTMNTSHPVADHGPPFTIQRIAEVLISPERYYTQTHKLCNCLEKLLLVTSTPSAFGGSTGGDTSQSRLEERELAALADEKGRLHSEFRERRRKIRTSSPSDDVAGESSGSGSKHSNHDSNRSPTPEKQMGENGIGDDGSGGLLGSGDSHSREMLEAAARASLRTKFDHVGLDPHSSAVVNRDVRSIVENRGMTNSPPPPSLSLSAGGLLRQHSPQHSHDDHHGLARASSPILFHPGGEGLSPTLHHSNPNMHLLQMHHAAALAGVSPFELVGLHSADGVSGGHSGPTTSGAPSTGMTTKDVDQESRSSASSDVDSESDDVSFDDSASDRSDGSDSGHYEPFTAARAMALNRMQQQRLQNRMLGSYHQGEGNRPLADSEYQAGDNVDALRAEDSGGSDSSSSDMAD